MAKASMTLFELMAKFPDKASAEAWFRRTALARRQARLFALRLGQRADGLQAQDDAFRCREKECAKRFSLKTGTVMQSSKLGLPVWAIAMFILISNVKGASS